MALVFRVSFLLLGLSLAAGCNTLEPYDYPRSDFEAEALTLPIARARESAQKLLRDLASSEDPNVFNTGLQEVEILESSLRFYSRRRDSQGYVTGRQQVEYGFAQLDPYAYRCTQAKEKAPSYVVRLSGPLKALNQPHDADASQDCVWFARQADADEFLKSLLALWSRS